MSITTRGKRPLNTDGVPEGADDANGGETMTHADANGYFLCLNVALFCIGMNKIKHHHIFNVDTLQCAWQEAEGGKGNQLYIC